MEQSYPLSQPQFRLQMAPCVRAHTPHTTSSRLKAVGIRVGLIASVWTDQLSLQSQPGGEHKRPRKSRKEHLIYHQQFYNLTFAFQPFLSLLRQLRDSSLIPWYAKIKDLEKSQIFPDYFPYTVQDFRQKIEEANSPNRVTGNCPPTLSLKN